MRRVCSGVLRKNSGYFRLLRTDEPSEYLLLTLYSLLFPTSVRRRQRPRQTRHGG